MQAQRNNGINSVQFQNTLQNVVHSFTQRRNQAQNQEQANLSNQSPTVGSST